MAIASVTSYAALSASSGQFGEDGTDVVPFKLIMISLNLSAEEVSPSMPEEIHKISTEETIGCLD